MADAGYFGNDAIEHVQAMGTELLVPAERPRHGSTPVPLTHNLLKVFRLAPHAVAKLAT